MFEPNVHTSRNECVMCKVDINDEYLDHEDNSKKIHQVKHCKLLFKLTL